jgi:hypothetical protein
MRKQQSFPPLLLLKMLILPRQARDKHTGKTQQSERPLSQVALLKRLFVQDEWTELRMPGLLQVRNETKQNETQFFFFPLSLMKKG